MMAQREIEMTPVSEFFTGMREGAQSSVNFCGRTLCCLRDNREGHEGYNLLETSQRCDTCWIMSKDYCRGLFGDATLSSSRSRHCGAMTTCTFFASASCSPLWATGIGLYFGTHLKEFAECLICFGSLVPAGFAAYGCCRNCINPCVPEAVFGSSPAH